MLCQGNITNNRAIFLMKSYDFFCSFGYYSRNYRSSLFIPIRENITKETKSISHRYLLKSGFIRQVGADLSLIKKF